MPLEEAGLDGVMLTLSVAVPGRECAFQRLFSMAQSESLARGSRSIGVP